MQGKDIDKSILNGKNTIVSVLAYLNHVKQALMNMTILDPVVVSPLISWISLILSSIYPIFLDDIPN